jgi:hypothetical protein
VWQTDAAGAFTALHLPAHVALRVQAPGFLATDLAQDLAGTPCTGQAEITLLRLGGRVAGRVLDSRRFPIRGARVRVEPAGGGTSWAVQGTMSAADGTFRLAAPASGAVLVRASHPDYVDGEVETEPGEGIEVMLSRGVRILGQVTDDIALPLSATVALRRDGRELRATMTRADGTFDAGRVAPGTYEVLAQAPGFADASLTIGVAEPAADAADAEQKVELALRRGVTLEGRVVDRFGDAVAGAQVEARAVSGEALPRQAVSDAEGRFTIGGLESGRYVVTAAREDLGEAEVDATLDVGTRGRPVELVFRDAVAPPPTGGTPEPAQASGRIGYSWANDEVIVRTPAAYHPPGTDPLVAGDVIFQVERERVRDIDTLQGILGKIHRATISVAVLRDGRRHFLTVDRQAMLADGW